ncbi:tetratricopeptide repeat protein [Catenulispora yoronensis]
MERSRRADDMRAVSLGLRNIADNYLQQGRYEEAGAAFEESIKVAIEVGDLYIQADSLNGLALTLRDRGLIVEARARAREAREVFAGLPEQEAARLLARIEASSMNYVE